MFSRLRPEAAPSDEGLYTCCLMRQLLRPLRKLFRLDHAVAGLSAGEAVVLEQGPMEAEQRRHTIDLVLAERPQHPVSRMFAVDAMNAKLGNERVVEPDDLAARGHSRVDTHTRPTRFPIGRDPPRVGRKPVLTSSALMRHSMACPCRWT